MTNEKISVGQAIDKVVSALTALEKREQQAVISMACSLLDISPNAVPSVAIQAPSMPPGLQQQAHIQTAPQEPNHPQRYGLDIRTLKDQKQPDSARQMACVVAYYLLDQAPEVEKKQTISSTDIEKYFKQAGYKLPSKLEQLLIDCKRSGYFEAVSRGEYKLTRVGYNLVTHSMPKRKKG